MWDDSKIECMLLERISCFRSHPTLFVEQQKGTSGHTVILILEHIVQSDPCLHRLYEIWRTFRNTDKSFSRHQLQKK